MSLHDQSPPEHPHYANWDNESYIKYLESKKNINMNLDDFKQGLHDSESPINQKEEPQQDDRTVEELITDKNTLGAILKLEEVRFEINTLRRYANNTNNQYLLKRLTKIYNQL